MIKPFNYFLKENLVRKTITKINNQKLKKRRTE